MAPLLGAIADDATGATDLCSVLVRGGMRTVQTIGVARDVPLPEADAVVVALKSRTAPAAEAVASALAALDWLRELGARQLFFKYCSTFDSTPEGNIGPVADALLDALNAELTVVCPAYPANGRTVYNGHLFVGHRLLSESSMARHPLTPMTDSDLVRVLARQTPRAVRLVPHDVVRSGARAVERRLEELAADGVAYAVTDALTDDDLVAIGAACAALPLVTGGAGVATGLPDNIRRRRLLAPVPQPTAPPPSNGPAVVLAGSVSAATREQVRRMAARFPAVAVDVVDPDVDRAERAVRAALGAGAVVVHTASSLEDVARAQQRLGAERAGEAAETVLAELARRLVRDGVHRIVVAGGETSGAVVSALGVRALRVGREIAPGVPWMTSVGDPPLALALKSGNFGGPEFFLQALGVR
ncbi:MAG: four-carbon acid sugar kinase family protein [Thermoleophilia bacterium]|nr:four-carbon acid sugar kinase family protein [Thermoleophilia bacterium]